MTDEPSPARQSRHGRAILVSPELSVLVGVADEAVAVPQRVVSLIVDTRDNEIRFHRGAFLPAAKPDTWSRDGVALLIDEAVFARLDSRFPAEAAGSGFRLPAELRPVARAMIDCEAGGEAGNLYCAAKAVELLCEIVRRLDADALLPQAADAILSDDDTVRILRARHMIDECWRDRLTLDRIASHCGINRDKLTRGYRSLFGCSVAEAIAERRLSEAERMLLSTRLPVATVGYRSGYLNNASFSRAFARRFGIAPRDYRVQRLAA